MKQKINKLRCKIFGHGQTINEVYAKRLAYTKDTNPLYNIVSDTVCLRCDKVLHREIVAYAVSKEFLLRNGWFINEE